MIINYCSLCHLWILSNTNLLNYEMVRASVACAMEQAFGQCERFCTRHSSTGLSSTCHGNPQRWRHQHGQYRSSVDSESFGPSLVSEAKGHDNQASLEGYVPDDLATGPVTVSVPTRVTEGPVHHPGEL